MQIQKIFLVLAVSCTVFVFATTPEEQADITESIIKKEIERFKTIKEKFVEEGVNVIAQFSTSKVDEDGSLIKRDSFELRPLIPPKKHLSEESKSFSRDNLGIIFDLAKKHNVSSAASSETFDEHGLLTSKTVFADFVKIQYNDGDTEIKIREDPDDNEKEDEDEVEELVGLLKEFELPVQATKDIYDDSGNLIKTDKTNYTPKRVKIDTGSSMPVDMQMKVSEALKRACAMKDTATARIKLLVRYLGIEFSDYEFHAVLGEDFQYLDHDVYIKITFDKNVYHVWGQFKKDEEEEEE